MADKITQHRSDESPAWPGGELPSATANDEFELFTEGDDLYADMIAAITTAHRSVRLESYIFADDEIGRWFAEVLAACARRGVKVWLHLDAAGSLFWGSRRFFRGRHPL